MIIKALELGTHFDLSHSIFCFLDTPSFYCQSSIGIPKGLIVFFFLNLFPIKQGLFINLQIILDPYNIA